MNKHRMIVVIAAALALAVSAVTPAQTSVGVMVGEPTGLSAKQWLGQSTAVDLAVAWSFAGAGAFYVHLDYQQHFAITDVRPGSLSAFVGAGGKISIRADEFRLGARIPLGLYYAFDTVPLEVFLEIAPGLMIFPATTFDAGGGIGIRYRF